jgi:hypothetical protein
MSKRGALLQRNRSARNFSSITRTLTPRNRSGAIEISFGMIFSIILIVAFLAFGSYAIIKFIDLQKDIQIKNFLNDFQNDVDNMWKSPQGSQVLTYSLPTKITSVCFISGEFHNLKFMSKGIIDGKTIEHLDIASITSVENPFCIGNIKGKVTLTIVKDFGETLVRVER